MRRMPSVAHEVKQAPAVLIVITGRPTDVWELTLPNNLTAIECFRVALRGVAFESAQPKHPVERVGGEPRFLALTNEAFEDRLDLATAKGVVQLHKEVRVADVTIVLRDLVLEDEVVAEGVPSEFADQTVILMRAPRQWVRMTSGMNDCLRRSKYRLICAPL